MQVTKRLAVLAVAGLGIGMLPSAPASARQGPDAAIDGLPYVAANAEPTKREWDDLRAAGERACRQAVDSAALVGEQLHVLTRQLSRTLVQVSGDVTRGMAQGMDQLAERLHEMAERMERPAE